MDIKEIRKKLPIGSINKIAEKTGASVGTINRFFEGKKIKPDVQLSILKATTEIIKNHKEKKENALKELNEVINS